MPSDSPSLSQLHSGHLPEPAESDLGAAPPEVKAGRGGGRACGLWAIWRLLVSPVRRGPAHRHQARSLAPRVQACSPPTGFHGPLPASCSTSPSSLSWWRAGGCLSCSHRPSTHHGPGAGSLLLLHQPYRPRRSAQCSEEWLVLCFSGSWAGNVPRRKHHFYQVKGGQVSAKWVEGGRWESRTGQLAGGARQGSQDTQQARRIPACKGPGGLRHLSSGCSTSRPTFTCLRWGQRQGPLGPALSLRSFWPQSSFELAGSPVVQGTPGWGGGPCLAQQG